IGAECIKRGNEGYGAGIRRLESGRCIKRRRLATLLQPDRTEITCVGHLRAGRTINNCRRLVFLAELLGGTLAVIVFLEMLPYEVRGKPVYGVNSQRDAAGPEVTTINWSISLFVEGIPVALGPFACDAQIDLVVIDRDIEHSFEP